MNCANCKSKKCKTGGSCSSGKNETILKYKKSKTSKIAKFASQLIDNGRAGTLSRVEELIEFINATNYKRVGLAYCYGFEKQARILSKLFKDNQIKHSAVCCTTEGIYESEIDESKQSKSVSCNPIGQAKQLKKEKVDLIVEMGLCLGHDILFHRKIKCDFTVLIVKDRKFNHCPLNGIIES